MRMRAMCSMTRAPILIRRSRIVAQLASDRMSCHSATANQVRLVLHTAAFWLMHGVRAAIPQSSPLASAEFALCSLIRFSICPR
jgi:hypothetical protein